MSIFLDLRNVDFYGVFLIGKGNLVLYIKKRLGSGNEVLLCIYSLVGFYWLSCKWEI